MAVVVTKPDTRQKLQMLSGFGQYDLACACGTREGEHRKRGADGRWIYPVVLPGGGTGSLFKTLISSVCNNDCKYCPLRGGVDIPRCDLGVEETARVFMDYYNSGKVFGLFLSSGQRGTADATMQRLTDIAELLRSAYRFRGYIHLKILPGSSAAAIEKALSLSSAVSLNIETPGAESLARLSGRKDYVRDIIEPMKLISALTAKGSRYEGVKKTTQFIVGAAGETDKDIVRYTFALYERLKIGRVYFSAYQKGLGEPDIPGEKNPVSDPAEVFVREHRLYQVDFLLRKYGFSRDDILFGEDGMLPKDIDPKENWANNHPEIFPVDINKAPKEQLLRVPGLGPTMVKRILQLRQGGRIGNIGKMGSMNKWLKKAVKYLVFS